MLELLKLIVMVTVAHSIKAVESRALELGRVVENLKEIVLKRGDVV